MNARDPKPNRPPVVFSMPDEECIWSKAGIIEPAKCINAFDCAGCRVEKSARENIEAKQAPAARAGAKGRAAVPFMPSGKCRHVLSGLISYGDCWQDNCANCPLEQMIEDSSHLPGRKRADVASASGFSVARNYYYHRGHAWARVEYGGRVRVGVDDFALRLLGRPDSIRTPEPGSTVSQGGPAFILERSGRQAALISPVDGVVVAVNRKALDPGFVSGGAPYEDGWLMVIQPTNLEQDLEKLFFDTEGLAWMDDEAMYLNALLAEKSKFSLVAAGSGAAGDVFIDAPEIGWDRLVSEFLA